MSIILRMKRSVAVSCWRDAETDALVKIEAIRRIYFSTKMDEDEVEELWATECYLFKIHDLEDKVRKITHWV